MPRRIYTILLLIGIVFSISTIPIFVFSFNPSNNLEVDFLDVGQGDSILIKTPYGQNILIDGGPDNKVIGELSKSMDWWDRQIDLMILTHPHDDHVTGLVDVLKRYDVKKILYTGVVHDTPNYIEWLEIIRDRKISLVIVDRPQQINLGENCDLDILYPCESVLGQEVNNLNNSSIVSMLDCEDKKFLFMGDAEREVEEELYLTSQSPLPAYRTGRLIIKGEASASERGEVYLDVDVLKAGHHGSDTSSSEEFLKMVSPEIVVIQVGEDNFFGHPSRRIIKRLERLNAEIFRNDEVGTVSIRVLDGELIIK